MALTKDELEKLKLFNTVKLGTKQTETILGRSLSADEWKSISSEELFSMKEKKASTFSNATKRSQAKVKNPDTNRLIKIEGKEYKNLLKKYTHDKEKNILIPLVKEEEKPKTVYTELCSGKLWFTIQKVEELLK